MALGGEYFWKEMLKKRNRSQIAAKIEEQL
jgi:hypothetical protein